MKFTLFVCAVAVLAAPAISQSCTGGRVYSSCGSPCNTTCENYQNPPICLTACAAGCFCPQGTVLHNDQCIDTSECPVAVTTPPPSTACTNGKIFNTCGTACPLTCDNHLNPPLRCTLQCVIGCFCPHGMVELGNTCVLPSSCPNAVTAPPTTPPPTPTCTNGKVFHTCGTACPRTCDNYQQEFLPCTRQCVIGCFCPEGMVEMGEECVLPSQCPGTNTTSSTTVTVATDPPNTACTNGKLFETCGTACPLTCDNYRSPPFACPAVCVMGCFCPHGLVELGDTCVLPTSCPDAVTAPPTTPPPTPTCTNGKVFHTCGTACPRTCDNYQQEFLPCTRQCVIGCFCPEGMVEMGEECVLPSQCPAAATTTSSTTVTVATDPPNTACTNGKLFETCGTACPLTCDNYRNPPSVCPAVCVMGCFCPRGLAELGDTCVPPTSCPDAVTAPPTTPPPTPTCTNGKVFHTCGTACPRTCDNYQQEFLPCTRQCVIGCFCPEGMVEMGEECVPPSQCPAAATTTSSTTVTVATDPPNTACTNGKLFETCGTACPLTCDNYRNPPSPCPFICVTGCFCPRGLAELGDTCVLPTSCPDAVTAPPTTPPPTPTCANGKVFHTCGTACPRTCDNYQQEFVPCTRQCVIGCFCPEGMVEMGEVCVSPSQCPAVTATMAPPVEPACTNGKLFETCGTACPLTCDNYRNPPSGCIDECIEGCFCPQGLVELGATCVPPSSCPDRECPDGMEYRDCGPLCPYTCDSYFGRNPCFSLRCAPGGCFCPENHVMADGRCTPAAVACQDTKPTVANVHQPSPIRLEMKIRNIAHEDFMNQEGIFLTSIKNLLANRGYGNVQANVHSITQDKHLVVVIQLNGDGISAAQAQELASLLSDQSSSLTLEIVEVTVSDSNSDDDSGVLSSPTIISIAVGASVVGLVLILLLSAILVACIVKRNRQVHHQEKYRRGTELDTVSTPHNDFMKNKLVRESLSY